MLGKESIHSAHERNSRAYNLRRRDFSFHVGDYIWRKNYVLSSAANQLSSKLAPKYILCQVYKKVSNLVYELKNIDGSKAGKWHIKDLKVYKGVDVDTSSTTSDED